MITSLWELVLRRLIVRRLDFFVFFHYLHRAIESIPTTDLTRYQRGEGVFMLLETWYDGRLPLHNVLGVFFFVECACLAFGVFVVVVDDNLHSLSFGEFFAGSWVCQRVRIVASVNLVRAEVFRIASMHLCVDGLLLVKIEILARHLTLSNGTFHHVIWRGLLHSYLGFLRCWYLTAAWNGCHFSLLLV